MVNIFDSTTISKGDYLSIHFFKHSQKENQIDLTKYEMVFTAMNRNT